MNRAPRALLPPPRAAAVLAAAAACVFACVEARAQSFASSAVGTRAAAAALVAQDAALLPGDSGGGAPGGEAIPMIATGSPHLIPGAFPVARPGDTLPRVFAPTRPRDVYTRYPWRRNIVTTVFWVGERPTRNNPTPNHMSAWDMRWVANFGGYDNPDPARREGYRPGGFIPGQNPFYFALPYNDISRTGTKASARAVIPWFDSAFYRSGRTVLKGRWIAIRKGGKVCYAQWEDVGPFETDDWEYVFGDARPKTRGNRGVGLDVSPAVRDYLEFNGGYGTVDWRFVEVDEVPDGPWKEWGTNNPFASPQLAGDAIPGAAAGIVRVEELRERLLASGGNPEEPDRILFGE